MLVSLVGLWVGYGVFAYGLWIVSQPILVCTPIPNVPSCGGLSDRLFGAYSIIIGLGIVVLSFIGLAFSSKSPVISPREGVD